MDDEHFSDEATEEGAVIAEDLYSAVSLVDDEPVVTVAKPQDETLVLRRRRVERLMDARRLSKQLFDYDEKMGAGHFHYDADWLDEAADGS